MEFMMRGYARKEFRAIFIRHLVAGLFASLFCRTERTVKGGGVVQIAPALKYRARWQSVRAECAGPTCAEWFEKSAGVCGIARVVEITGA
jgi:hypothetical protein